MKFSLIVSIIITSTFYVSSMTWAMETESSLSSARVVAAHSTPDGEVLATNVVHYPATTLAPEPTYPYTTAVIHNPRKVSYYRDQFRDLSLLESTLDTPPSVNEIIRSGRQDITHFGMGDHRFANDGEGFLYTDTVKDCIAVVAFDPGTGKSCLYHASKMEIRLNDFDERLLETYFIPEFKEHFKGLVPQVSLVASAFTQDLLDLKRLLEMHGIQIHRINVPDIALEYKETRDELEEYVSVSDTVFVNKDTVPSLVLQNTLRSTGVPTTSVMVDKKTGEVGVHRE